MTTTATISKRVTALVLSVTLAVGFVPLAPYTANADELASGTVAETTTRDISTGSIYVYNMSGENWTSYKAPAATGEPVRPNIKIKYRYSYVAVFEDNASDVVENDDFKVTFSNNVEAGDGLVTVEGKAPNYTGTVTETFMIAPAETASSDAGNAGNTNDTATADGKTDISNATLFPHVTRGWEIREANYKRFSQKFVYDGKAQKPYVYLSFKNAKGTTETYCTSPSVLDKKHPDGVPLPSDKFKVSCKNNVNAGTATVTVKGIGDYTGSVSAKFKISKADPFEGSYLPKSHKTKVVKASKLRKKAVKVKLSPVKTKAKNIAYSYSIDKSGLRKGSMALFDSIKLNKKTRVVTLKKGNYGTGFYSLPIKITAKSTNPNYEKKSYMYGNSTTYQIKIV